MLTSNAKTDAFAIADACFAKCQVVAKFIDEHVRVPVDTAAARQSNGSSLQGMLLRVIGWLRSLGKLNHPGDFQAVVSGTRALFEIAVDATLLEGDRATYPVEKLKVWELSAKLKNAATLKSYLDEMGKQPNSEQRHPLAFLAREGASIEAKQRQS